MSAPANRRQHAAARRADPALFFPAGTSDKAHPTAGRHTRAAQTVAHHGRPITHRPRRGEIPRRQGARVSDWLEVTQETINRFADLTPDDQWIHLDVERAKQSPIGGTIAHGYYVLSLAPRFSYDMFTFESFGYGLNYGLNRVRFPPPMPVGGRVRMRAKLARSRRSRTARRSRPSDV